MLRRAVTLLLALALSAAASGQTADVEVALEQFGTGSAYRPGDYASIQVSVTSTMAEAITAWVQVEIPNADGDIAEYGRSVSLTPNGRKTVWLYAPLPPKTDGGSVWTVRVFEMRDGRRRQELGGTRISPSNSQFVDSGTAMIAVVGNQRMLLDNLAVVGQQSQRPIAAHEPTRIVSGLRANALPDRWEGFLPFEAVVWSNAEPNDLNEPSTVALVEYVRRGGHLVICLEEAGNAWGLGETDNPPVNYDLWQLLPRRQPAKQQGVMLSELLPVLGKARSTVEDFDLTIQTFDDLPDDTLYEPLIKTPDGRTIVVQRLFGFGRITVIGVNVASPRINSIKLDNGSIGLPQGDVFWGRILGRRADAPVTSEIRQIEEDERLNLASRPENDLGSGRLFAESISMTQQAGVGLFLAFILFLAYWIVAGPGGYYVLKHFRQVHHAWLAFGAAAGLFTAIAWGVVSLVPTTDVTIRHLTFLDHVARGPNDLRNDELAADPQLQRANAWLSVFLDDYRDTEVAIVSDDDQRDLLASWSPPGMTVQTFPNVDRYQVDVARSPGRYELPGRSTATQLSANWLGGVDRGTFGKLIHVDPRRSHPYRDERRGPGDRPRRHPPSTTSRPSSRTCGSSGSRATGC